MKQHYALIVGEVYFQSTDLDQVFSIRCNGVLRTPNKTYAISQLATAQRILQMQAVQKAGEPATDGSHQIMDCVIHNIIYLGQFTEAEFQAKEKEGDISVVHNKR